MILLSTTGKCHLQLNKIIDDLDIDNIMDRCLELEMSKFLFQDVMVTAISQVMISGTRKGDRIVYNLSDGFMKESVYGDSLRLQQILADFLAVSVKYSPSGGLVEIGANLFRDRVGRSLHVINFKLRITHMGNGIPEELLAQMFGSEENQTNEGVSLLICRKLLKLTNGDVRYLREADKSSFTVTLELASSL